jgi:hypothetical protein
MELERLKELLVAIFRLDKTPEYSCARNPMIYEKNHNRNAADRFGRIPEEKGSRWRTPREIALEEWKKLGLSEQKLYDSAKGKNG